MAEIGHTDISPILARVVVAAFALLVLAVPLVQVLRNARDGDVRRDFRIETITATRPATDYALGDVGRRNALMMRQMAAFESGLEDRSWLTALALEPTRRALVHTLRQGNEDAYVGRDGWLYYRPSVASLTGPPFLDPTQLARRAAMASETTQAPQPDPRIAILDLHNQLSARGIQLVIIPAPAKPSIYPEHLSRRYRATDAAIHNPSYQAFCAEMRAAGVWVYDPAAALAAARETEDGAMYLRTDTHWTPAGMDRVARELADVLTAKGAAYGPEMHYTDAATTVTAQGDIAAMLSLAPDDPRYGADTVTIHPVIDSRRDIMWSADPAAEILLLGDSYANIYSLPGMGWGESAGFAERLSFHLQRPLDRIVRNDAGAWASRDMLRRDLARGRLRLEGKRLVIWEFAARELAVGDWRVIPLVDGEPPDDGDFIAPPPGDAWTVTGEVVAIAPLPPAGSPYKDLRIALQLANLTSPDTGIPDGAQIVTYTLGLRDFTRTAAAGWREGERVTLRIQPWDDVVDRYEGLRVSDLTDDTLELLDTWCWATELEDHDDAN